VTISKTEFGLNLMNAIGAQAGVTYLSAPITTGYRDISLMRELGVTKDALRTIFPTEFRDRVIRPNEREAHKYAQMVRRRSSNGGVVVNPGALFVPDWSQRDYMNFWEETIRSYCMEVVLAPGWEYSSGARYEAAISLQTMLKLSDVHGHALSAVQLQQIDRRARNQLLSEGYSAQEIEAYMPMIDFVAASADTDDFGQNIHAFSDIVVRHNRDAQTRNEQDGQKTVD
jgi:hypothetical protein